MRNIQQLLRANTMMIQNLSLPKCQTLFYLHLYPMR